MTADPPVEQKFVEVTSQWWEHFALRLQANRLCGGGDRISRGQTVCIIRLQLMNEIEAEVSGQVIEILVQNGEPVEFGQPLLRVNLINDYSINDLIVNFGISYFGLF